MEHTNTKTTFKRQTNSASSQNFQKQDCSAQFVTLLKIQQVVSYTAVPKSSIYRKISQGKFPKPVRLGKNAVAWRSDDIQDWINNRERVYSDCWQENV
ncbi:MAG: helix-turn-helix transcriptional regulator [Draconibacterium sp.]